MLFKPRETTSETFWHRTFGPTAGAVALFLAEVLQIVIIVVAIVVPIRYFLIQPFYVKGASMEPSFYDHEYLIINEISYRFSQPERGEIIVFHYPRDPSQFFIKRVIGLPGETVTIADGRVMIAKSADTDPEVLDEVYLDGAYTSGHKTVTLGADEYFVMGDNRDASLDSRSFGPIPQKSIVGKVWLRGLPFNKIHVFSTPMYE